MSATNPRKPTHFLCCLLLLCSAGAAVPGFSVSVYDLETIPGITLANDPECFSGEILLHPFDGSIHIAWVKNGDIHRKIRYFDGTWSDTETLPDYVFYVYGQEEANHRRQCIGMTFDPEGFLHVVFAVDNGDLYYMNNRQGSWMVPDRIVKKPQYTIHPDIEIIGDVVHVVYEDSETDIMYYLNYDGEWSPPEALFLGEYPHLYRGSQDRLYFYARGTRDVFRNIRFAYRPNNASDWIKNTDVTDAEEYLGTGPDLAIREGRMFLVWPSNTGEGIGPRKSGIHCALAEEPGSDWTSRVGGTEPIMYENTGDPCPQVAVYSDGTLLLMTGRRLHERFLIWGDDDWTDARTAPWEDYDDRDGIIPSNVCDGRTAWVLSGFGKIALYGIRNPEAEVLAPPKPAFSADVTAGFAPLTVRFSGSFQGEVSHWLWDFGDGGSSTSQNPSHAYESAGAFTVRLTVYGPWGNSETVRTEYIRVETGPPVADFSADPVQGMHPLAVQFTDESAGWIDTWSWDFGDGQASSLQNPEHTYADIGSYTVSLTVTGEGGTDTETKTDYIRVTGPPPIAAFTGSPREGTIPHTVQFTDASTGDIDTWSWDFGDGQASSLPSPSHVYTTAGPYTVALTVSGPWGSSTETKTDYILARGLPPSADFTADPTRGAAPLSVTFTDGSAGEIDTWSWDFGDGGTSSSQNPAHIFEDPGLYTVNLTVSGPWGESTETKTDLIEVRYPTPVADFIADPTAGTIPLEVQFTDASNGQIDSYAWNFGDGASSSLANPLHTYTATGLYSVTLTVSGPGGSSSTTKTDYIDARGLPPVASFSADPLEGVAPLGVQFSDASTGDILSRAWDFGDGASSTDQNPEHTYGAAGSYTVRLTVSGPWGSATETKTDYITVLIPPPAAAFSADTTKGDAPLTVRFTDLSAGRVDSWFWDFGDGAASEDQHPVHIYTQAGLYSVKLTVANTTGSDQEEKAAYITVTDVTGIGETGAVPDAFRLHQNYPNPFNPATTVGYDLPEKAAVSLSVFDMTGKKIRNLFEGEQPAGTHSVDWDGSDEYGQRVTTGTYLIVLRAGPFTARRKVLFLK